MTWVWYSLTVYFVGAVFTFAFNNRGAAPVLLALLRGFLWPLWWLTGKPEGQTYRID